MIRTWCHYKSLSQILNNTNRGAVRDILIRGGDTDTNAAIVGGLLGAR